MREKGVRGERGARVIFMKGLKNERKERENLHLFLHFRSCTYWGNIYKLQGFI